METRTSHTPMTTNNKLLTLISSLVTLLLGGRSAPLFGASRQILREHVPPAASRLTPLGRVPDSNHLDLVLGLPLRNQEELSLLLAQLYDPLSTNYHQYLSPEQFAERFGPAAEHYEALKAFARENGLTITGLHSNRTLLDVNASVRDIERTFAVHLQSYQHPGEPRQFFAPDVDPSVELPFRVLHISGLDNYVVPRPPGPRKILADRDHPLPLVGSGPSGSYLGKDFRAAYVPGSLLDGTGQTVALVQFGGYLVSDITNYEAVAGVPNVPLQNVLLNGYGGQTNVATREVELDIEMVIGMAPGLSKVMVYEGIVANDILNRIATDNLARQISASYIMASDSITEQILRQYVAQGQSFFNSSGDAGAYSGQPQTPNETNVTVVGGTTLSTTGPQGAWAAEVAWNGSGGGIQSVFTIPTWQQGIDMSANKGSTTHRNTPDVAMDANGGAYIFEFGQSGTLGGTSEASPLFAGFCALINQQAALAGKPAVGFLNPALYELGKSPFYRTAFHDITVGNNTNSTMPTNFFAVPGYDLCTGWGTPTGTNLINALVGTPWFVWVQFGNPSPGNGSFASPYNTLVRATNGVLAGGTVLMEGGPTSEIMRIGKAMTLRSSGSVATIGR